MIQDRKFLKRTSLSVLILIGLMSTKVISQTLSIYISPSGNDNASGTLQQPLKTITAASEKIRLNRSKYQKIDVWLKRGTYQLSAPLQFDSENSGSEACAITYSAFPGEEVIISGGRDLSGSWKSEGGNVWSLDIPEVKKGVVFRQLFLNGTRLQRAGSEVFFTDGPLAKYQAANTKRAFRELNKQLAFNLDAYCGFKFQNRDLLDLDPVDGTELLVYHSWEASWHEIASIDKSNRSVFLKNPSRYPVGFFSPNLAYRIENNKQFFKKPGQWLLDHKNGKLYYYTRAGEDPNKLKFTIPVINKLLVIQGNSRLNTNAGYMTFKGISFRYTNTPWGITDKPSTIRDSALINFPWMDFSRGYSDAQTSPKAGAAITLKQAKNCSFIECKFGNLGGNAIYLQEGANNNVILNSHFRDLGAGGVLIGILSKDIKKDGILPASIPSGNSVIGCLIENGGKFALAGVGIAIFQASGNTIRNNEIRNFPYTGISSGFTFGFFPNYSSGNKILNNHIHHVMTELADGGGIYTLGPQEGTLIKGNYIHDIGRSKYAVGGNNNGIFFDEGSSLMKVDSNVVFAISQEDLRFNATDSPKVNWGNNSFQKDKSNIGIINYVKAHSGPKMSLKLKDKKD